MLDCQFCFHASEGPVIIMNELKSIYNSPFKDLHSHPYHTCFPIIASNEFRYKEIMLTTDSVTKNSCLERIRLQRVHTYNEFGYKRVVLTTNSVIKSSWL